MHPLLFAAAIAIPKIDLLYPPPFGNVYHRNCAAASAEEVKEAVRRNPEFQKLWDDEGPAYLRAAFKEIEKPFPYHQMQMAMTVCPGTSTKSTRLKPGHARASSRRRARKVRPSKTRQERGAEVFSGAVPERSALQTRGKS